MPSKQARAPVVANRLTRSWRLQVSSESHTLETEPLATFPFRTGHRQMIRLRADGAQPGASLTVQMSAAPFERGTWVPLASFTIGNDGDELVAEVPLTLGGFDEEGNYTGGGANVTHIRCRFAANLEVDPIKVESWKRNHRFTPYRVEDVFVDFQPYPVTLTLDYTEETD